jgi:hypothetical protein
MNQGPRCVRLMEKKTLTSTAQLLYALCWKKPRPSYLLVRRNIETVLRPDFSPRWSVTFIPLLCCLLEHLRYYRWFRVAIFAEKSRLWWVYCYIYFFVQRRLDRLDARHWACLNASLKYVVVWRHRRHEMFSGGFRRDRYRKSERGTRQFGFTDFTEIEFAD